MCILTADLNLRWAAMFNCVTVSHWSCCFFNREELFRICCTGEMERAMKMREKSTHQVNTFFLFLFPTHVQV